MTSSNGSGSVAGGGVCWYCHWGWALPVACVYLSARAELRNAGIEGAGVLLYGPGHVVWGDENWDDENIRGAIRRAAWWRGTVFSYFDDVEVSVCLRSLEALLAIPEGLRDCCPADYDGDDPEGFPPAVGIEMVKVR